MAVVMHRVAMVGLDRLRVVADGGHPWVLTHPELHVRVPLVLRAWLGLGFGLGLGLGLGLVLGLGLGLGLGLELLVLPWLQCLLHDSAAPHQPAARDPGVRIGQAAVISISASNVGGGEAVGVDEQHDQLAVCNQVRRYVCL